MLTTVNSSAEDTMHVMLSARPDHTTQQKAPILAYPFRAQAPHQAAMRGFQVSIHSLLIHSICLLSLELRRLQRVAIGVHCKII